jgi:hypothetical protein
MLLLVHTFYFANFPSSLSLSGFEWENHFPPTMIGSSRPGENEMELCCSFLSVFNIPQQAKSGGNGICILILALIY